VSLTFEEPTEVEEPAWELRAALADLPEQQRAALVLHYYGGYPARDVALITGATPAGVWMALSRGRRRLRHMLEVADD
jgi:RNA polymerase sigma factor (sigma-70 family)